MAMMAGIARPGASGGRRRRQGLRGSDGTRFSSQTRQRRGREEYVLEKRKLTQKGAPEPPGGTLFLLEKDVTVATCRSCRYICREQPTPGTVLRTCFPCDVLSGFPVWPT